MFAQLSGPSGAGCESVPVHLSVSGRRKPKEQGWGWDAVRGRVEIRQSLEPGPPCAAFDSSWEMDSPDQGFDPLRAIGGAPRPWDSAPTIASCLSSRPSIC